MSGSVGLLLGLVGRVDLQVSALRPEQGHRTVGTDLPTVVAVSAVAAGLVALAVYGAAPLRARAGRWADVLAPAARAAAVPVGLATAAALAVAVFHPDLLQPWVYLPVAANGGLLLLGLGSGATVRLAGGDVSRTLSLFDLGGAGGQWRWALLPAVAGALVLARAAYSRGLGAGDRLRLAVLYAVLLAVPMLAGLSMRYRFGLGMEPGTQQEHGYSVSLTVGTVLVAVLLWAALGAFALPALFAAVRPAPAGRGAPSEHRDGAPWMAVRPRTPCTARSSRTARRRRTAPRCWTGAAGRRPPPGSARTDGQRPDRRTAPGPTDSARTGPGQGKGPRGGTGPFVVQHSASGRRRCWG
ncbi:hypothetical protein [Kitasatospora paranensis]|uniref:hypothetical protein n=1 Tax=Kitasatospora paranensis TaxID=258053 RepID=UPI0031ED7A92